jgi:hypothetical protein
VGWPVSATLAMSHLPSTRTRLKRSVPLRERVRERAMEEAVVAF